MIFPCTCGQPECQICYPPDLWRITTTVTHGTGTAITWGDRYQHSNRHQRRADASKARKKPCRDKRGRLK